MIRCEMDEKLLRYMSRDHPPAADAMHAAIAKSIIPGLNGYNGYNGVHESLGNLQP
jgi:hypothetical protein